MYSYIATVQVTSHMSGSIYVPACVKLKNLVFSYRFLYTGFVGTLVKVHTHVTHQRCSMCIYIHVMSIHFTGLHYT